MCKTERSYSEREGIRVHDMLSVLKNVMTVVAAEMVGYTVYMIRKNVNAWLTSEIKEATEGKRRA